MLKIIQWNILPESNSCSNWTAGLWTGNLRILTLLHSSHLWSVNRLKANVLVLLNLNFVLLRPSCQTHDTTQSSVSSYSILQDNLIVEIGKLFVTSLKWHPSTDAIGRSCINFRHHVISWLDSHFQQAIIRDLGNLIYAFYN